MTNYRENSDQIELSLPKQGYAAFDAAGLKNLIIERLNANQVFTDQNYEGSNINAFIDVVSYAYHVLLFYLNNTSNESLFTESQIYENINRIVKSLDYKPIGTQSPVLSITGSANSSLVPGTYTLPRYSSVSVKGVKYCFTSDVTFVKTIVEDQQLDEFSGDVLLHQGNVVEYPEYTSTGEPNEILTLVPEENTFIDHFSIDVYVLEGGEGGQYHKYESTASQFFSRPTTRAVEIRQNENKRYEIKFGNNVNGKQLQQGDIVYVYYIVTEGESGEVQSNAAVNKSVVTYKSSQLDSILASNNVKGDGVIYMNQSQSDNILISNNDPSTKFYTGETVDDIKENAPKTFSSQYRLVSINDYESYIKSNFSNFITDVKALDNQQYLDTHIKYYYDMGMKSPGLESRVLTNQVQFSTSCNFNNLYIYCVPRLERTNSLTKRANYLTSAQKELILNRMSNTKTITCDPIIMDPVYMSVDIGVRGTDELLNHEQSTKTNMLIVQEDNSRVNSNDIIQKVVTIMREYFKPTSARVGMILDLTTLSNEILSIKGINTFYTYRPDLGGTYVEGLSLMIWNSVYTSDVIQTTQNYRLAPFKFPFFEQIETLGTKIRVTRSSNVTAMLNTSSADATMVSTSDMMSSNGSYNDPSSSGSSTSSSSSNNY